MDINTEKYGTTGLPKFGPGYTHGTVAAATPAVGQGIGEVDAAFNGLIAAVKKNCLPGNTALLWFFGVSVKGLYAIAYSLLTEKPVINA